VEGVSLEDIIFAFARRYVDSAFNPDAVSLLSYAGAHPEVCS
jgi:hypothetical protein